MNNELITKAKEAASEEELLSLAKENNIEITEEQAREYFERLHASGELADDELTGVAGGGCGSPKCPTCGSHNIHHDVNRTPYTGGWTTYKCLDCGSVWIVY